MLLFVGVPAIGVLVNAMRRGYFLHVPNDTGLDVEGFQWFLLAMSVVGFVAAYLRRIPPSKELRNCVTASLFGVGYGLGCGFGFAGESLELWGLAALTTIATAYVVWCALDEVVPQDRARRSHSSSNPVL